MNCIDFLNDLRSSDFESWILVQKEFVKNFHNEYIFEIGYNKNSRYVYIELENGLTIASCLGYPVVYIVANEDGDETIFESYEELLAEML